MHTQWSLDWFFQTFFILLRFVISGEEGKMLKSR